MTAAFDALELELRQIPGVIGVGVEEADGALIVGLLTSTPAPPALLLQAAGQVARNHAEGQVVLTVSPGRGGTGTDLLALRRERVQLVAVNRSGPAEAPVAVAEDAGAGDARADGAPVEVQVCFQGTQRVGRATGVGPRAAAAATLAAVESLGIEVPFGLKAAMRLAGWIDGGVVVIVVLAPLTGGQDRLGVAQAATVDEAASRAALSGLNRFLSDDRARTGWAPAIADASRRSRRG